jgi:hypothetical protein
MAKEIFTGTLHPTSPNNLDGSYPDYWRHFYVDTGEGEPQVSIFIETGGARENLLKMSNKTVSIEGWRASPTLAQGDESTIKVVG